MYYYIQVVIILSLSLAGKMNDNCACKALTPHIFRPAGRPLEIFVVSLPMDRSLSKGATKYVSYIYRLQKISTRNVSEQLCDYCSLLGVIVFW